MSPRADRSTRSVAALAGAVLTAALLAGCTSVAPAEAVTSQAAVSSAPTTSPMSPPPTPELVVRTTADGYNVTSDGIYWKWTRLAHCKGEDFGQACVAQLVYTDDTSACFQIFGEATEHFTDSAETQVLRAYTAKTEKVGASYILEYDFPGLPDFKSASLDSLTASPVTDSFCS